MEQSGQTPTSEQQEPGTNWMATPLRDWPDDVLVQQLTVYHLGGSIHDSIMMELARRKAEQQTAAMVDVSKRLEIATWFIAFMTAVNVLAVVITVVRGH